MCKPSSQDIAAHEHAVSGLLKLTIIKSGQEGERRANFK